MSCDKQIQPEAITMIANTDDKTFFFIVVILFKIIVPGLLCILFFKLTLQLFVCKVIYNLLISKSFIALLLTTKVISQP